MMKRTIPAALTLVLLLLLAAPADAREKVKLKGGRTLVGKIESQDEEEIVLRTEAGGVLRIKQADVVSIVALKEAPKADEDADTAAEPKDTPAADGDTTKSGKDPAPDEPKPGATAPAGGAAAKKGQTEEPDEEWKAKVLAELGDRVAKTRAAAAQAIVDAWPGSAKTLDAALSAKDKTVRLEAVRLLGRKELGDTQARIRLALNDRYPPVRQMAARAVRHRQFPMEKDLIPLVRDDPEARVAIEAIRALEDVGTWRCYRALYRRWNNESDEELKRRYRRNLKRILKEDHGDDEQAWLKCVEDAIEKARTEKPK